jgi:hypothetical protein
LFWSFDRRAATEKKRTELDASSHYHTFRAFLDNAADAIVAIARMRANAT